MTYMLLSNYILFFIYLSALLYIQGRLNSTIGPGQSCALGPLPKQPLTGIKLIFDKIKHIFIILIFPTKSVFKNIKKHAIHNIHRLAWGLMLVGPPLNCPTCPCTKTALCIHFVAQSISSRQID